MAAALQGLGIADAFDRERIDEHFTRGELVEVLSDWAISRQGLFLYHFSRHHFSSALRAFIDCMLDKDVARNAQGTRHIVEDVRFSDHAPMPRAQRRCTVIGYK